MRKVFVVLLSTAASAVLLQDAKGADSGDALIVLTTVGYLTGAADGCKVVPKESNQLGSGMATAIGSGNYGQPAQAQVLFNNARQKGVDDAVSGKANCPKVADAVRKYVRALVKK